MECRMGYTMRIRKTLILVLEDTTHAIVDGPQTEDPAEDQTEAHEARVEDPRAEELLRTDWETSLAGTHLQATGQMYAATTMKFDFGNATPFRTSIHRSKSPPSGQQIHIAPPWTQTQPRTTDISVVPQQRRT